MFQKSLRNTKERKIFLKEEGIFKNQENWDFGRSWD